MDLNMANRQCCKLDIREYGSNQPWMYADFCNTTTAGFSSDPVYAMKMGSKAIKFDNPLDATMALTFQVHPFRIYSLLSDGEIETSAVIPVKEEVEAATAGTLTLTDTPIEGTVYVYAEGEFGGEAIAGSESGQTFSAASAADIEVGTTYTVAYLVNKTSGVKKVSFNNKKLPKDFRITQETLDKDERGNLVPMKLTAFKASPQRNMEWSFSSDGDPAELTVTFDVLEDSEGNIMEIAEISE